MKIKNNWGSHYIYGVIPYILLVFLFQPISICYAINTTQSNKIIPEGTVAHCFDGDTFKLMDRRIVRLAGIDAPELGKQNKKAQFYARQAKDELIQLARGKKIKLLLHGVSYKDNHGRILAEVLIEGDRSLNKLMIENGAAYFSPHQDLDPQFQDDLLKLQVEAIKERRGMWEKILSSPIANNNYVGNRASMRFYPENCPEALNIKPRNRIHFGTLMDAFLSGFAPSRSCVFWPDSL